MRNPIELAHLFAVGDRVVGRYTYRARHTGPFVGVPASGAVITLQPGATR